MQRLLESYEELATAIRLLRSDDPSEAPWSHDFIDDPFRLGSQQASGTV